ncbi:MAG TPA: transposase [Umezawaea sp.]|nr:transposase [Umezawaea sp.]
MARAAHLLCAHYLPVGRATALMGGLVGAPVSTGFMAGVRGRAARLLEQTFLPRVRQLLREAGVLHVDETVRHEAPVRREALGVEGGGRPSRRVVAAARSKRSAA